MRLYAMLPAAFLCCAALAQENKASSPTPFQVEYTIHDANDSASKNGRHYVLQIDNLNSRGTIRSGAKVPYTTGAQWNYADIGVNIDCRLYERDGRLMMNSSFDLSSIASSAQSGANPTVNQVRTETSTVVTLGKQMTLLTIDDPQIQRKLQVDTLVSQVK
jgi:hypothetical protein